MKAVIAGLALSLTVGAAQAQAPIPKVTMAPPSGVLERDLRLFESWFPGEFDNAEQVFFAEEQGVAVPRRLHAKVTAVGPHAFQLSYFAANDLTRPVEERQVTATVDAAAGGLKLSSPGCDIRWTRRDIQSVALLAQVLAKQAAAEAGAGEAWMIEDGKVTEGGSSSCFILTQDDVIVTRQNGSAILPGCTRKAVVALAEERQLRVEERPFTIEEALAAKEAFITSATVFVQAVVTIDGKTVANGKPGPMTKRLREIYVDFAKATAV